MSDLNEKKNKLMDSGALLGLGKNLINRRQVEIEMALGERKPSAPRKSYEDMDKGERKEYFDKTVGKPVGTASTILPSNEDIKNNISKFAEHSKRFGGAIKDVVTGTPNMVRKIAKEQGWLGKDKPKPVVKPQPIVEPIPTVKAPAISTNLKKNSGLAK